MVRLKYGIITMAAALESWTKVVTVCHYTINLTKYVTTGNSDEITSVIYALVNKSR